MNPSYNQPTTADGISDDSWLGDVSLEDLEDYSLESSNGDFGNGGGGGGGGTKDYGSGGSGCYGGGSNGGGSGSCGAGGSGGSGGGNGGGNGDCGGYDSGGGGGGVEDGYYCDGDGGLDDEAILDRVANEMDFNFTDEASTDHHSVCAVMRSTSSTVESSDCETDHQARGGICNASDPSQSQSHWCSTVIK